MAVSKSKWFALCVLLVLMACSEDPDRDGGGNNTTTGTSTGTATGTGTSTGVGGSVSPPPTEWRPFNDESPWNTPIGADPAIDPESAAMIADLEVSSPYGEHLDVNIAGYSIPLYWADESTPTVQVSCDIGGLGFTGDDGFDATAMVPMPANAAPDPESDHHLLIVDLDAELEWGMWNTAYDGSWTCGLGANIDLTGTGMRPIAETNPTWYTSHGPRACGFPLIAGLIRTAEIEAGRIDHALVFAYPHIRSGWYRPPASTGQARIGDDAVSWRGVPCGGRIQLDPDLDLDTLPGLTATGRIIALALQEYGAYIGDYSGAMSLYAENSPEAQAYWANGVLDTYELQDVIDMAWFRVLDLGTLYDNGNGD